MMMTIPTSSSCDTTIPPSSPRQQQQQQRQKMDDPASTTTTTTAVSSPCSSSRSSPGHAKMTMKPVSSPSFLVCNVVGIIIVVAMSNIHSTCHAFQNHQHHSMMDPMRLHQSSSLSSPLRSSSPFHPAFFTSSSRRRYSLQQSSGNSSNENNNTDGGDQQKELQSLSRTARKILVSSVATMMFVFSSLVGLGPVTTGTLPASAAVDIDDSAKPTESTLLQGSPTASNDDAQQQQQQQQQQQNDSTGPTAVVEEVWNLINKYYIDRSFNGQQWDDVHAKVLSKTEKMSSNSDGMKVVTDMVNSLGDKYTRVLSPDQYAAIQKYDLIGVGVTLMPSPVSKEIIVGAPPIEGSSSYKAGLKTGDFVVSVNGKPTRGRTAFDIIDQISEDPNAKTVTFGILRKKVESSIESLGDIDSAETFDVTLDRQTMEVKDPVTYKLSETRKDGTKVGYIRVSEFNTFVQSSLMKAIQDLKHQGANAYVLDLRSNTGGAFQSAVEISGMFLPPDRVATYVVDSNQVELPFRTPKSIRAPTGDGDYTSSMANPTLPLVDPDVPLVIWIDQLSASASEVLVGSLHDNCRAVTMGDTNSFGKGLIQAVYGLKNGAGLVLTVAKYITPAGTEIQGIGLKPDISGSMPPPVFIPVFGSDTSKVDFKDISKRLSSDMCSVPKERVMAGGAATPTLLQD